MYCTIQQVHRSTLFKTCHTKHHSNIVTELTAGPHINKMVERMKAAMRERLAMLQKREEDLSALLESVDVSLQEMGFQVSIKPSSSKTTTMMPQTGINIGGQLSFRGKEKAAEYFNLIDTDKDGYVNFEDLRGTIMLL